MVRFICLFKCKYVSDREREKGERKASIGIQDELNVIGGFKQTQCRQGYLAVTRCHPS